MSSMEMDCCLLCPQPLPSPPKASEDDTDTDIAIPDRGPLMPVNGSSDMVHEHCADFAEGVFEVSKQYYFVARAISKAATPCAYAPCSGIGATSRCAVDDCDKRYHFMCAIYDGATRVDDGSKFYCVDHPHKAPKLAVLPSDNGTCINNNINDENGNRNCAAGESENMEICFMCSNGGNLVCCDFCENAVHQACVGLVEVPEGEYKCSVCTGDANGNFDNLEKATQATSEHEDIYFTPASQGTCTPLRNTGTQDDDAGVVGTSFMVTASPGYSDATISPPRDLSSPFKKTQAIDDDNNNDIFNVDVPLNSTSNTQVSNPVITEEKQNVRKSPKLPKPPHQEGTSCFECGTSDDNLMPCDTCNRVVHPDCAGQHGIPTGDFSCSMCTGETTGRDVDKDEEAGNSPVVKAVRADIDTDNSPPSQGKQQVSPFVKSKTVAKIESKSPATKKKKNTKKPTTPKILATAKSKSKPSKVSVASKATEPKKDTPPNSKTSPKKRKSPKSITANDPDIITDVDVEEDPSPKRRRASANGNFQWQSWGTKRVQASAFKMSQVTPTKHPVYVLCATGLNEAQKDMLNKVARKKCTKVRESFDRKVTHMVINAYEEGDAPPRTIKLCKAVAAGVKLVRFKWITDALDAEDSDDEWPDVEEYVHQLSRTAMGKLFSGMEFYFGTMQKFGDMKGELADIVQLGGGTVLTKKPTVSKNNKKRSRRLMLVEEAATRNNKNKKKGPRRGSLSEIRDKIAGTLIVEPQYILDQCVAQS